MTLVHISSGLLPALAGLVSAILTCALLFWAQALATAGGLLDHPDGNRKVHQGAVPLMGGIVVCLPALALSVIIALATADARLVLLPAVAVGFAFFTLGLIDDRLDVPASVRIALTVVLAGLLPVAFPVLLGAIPLLPSLTGTVLLVALTVAITPHAINLADGDHGIATGILLVLSAALLDAVHDPYLTTLLVAVAVGSGLFLLANMSGRIFLGSSGCYGISAILVGIALTAAAVSADPAPLLACCAVLAIPVGDAVRVVVGRLRAGRAPLSPDRTHLHHILRRTVGWPNSAFLYWLLVLLPVVLIVPGRATALLLALLCLTFLLRLTAAERVPARQPRLLYLVNDVSFFLSHRLPLALEAQSRGYEVHVAARQDADIAPLERLGLHFHRVRFDPTGLNPVLDILSLLQIAVVCHRIAPDVIHLVTIKPVLYGGLVARALGIRGVIAAVPGLGMVFTTKGPVFAVVRALVHTLYRLALNHSRCLVVVQNVRDRDLLVGMEMAQASQVRRIPGSGVCLRSFRPAAPPPGSPVVLFASRLIRQKGIEEFVEAARLCHAKGIAARFVIAGEPPRHHRAAITRGELGAWCADGTIEWWGRSNHMPMMFDCAHIFCLPTYYPEGIPKVLLEAAAAGKPIITTAMPGCAEVVQDGVNGFLVPPRDAVSVAEALLVLLEDDEIRARMGRLSRAIAERRFGVDTVIDATMDLYAEVLDEPMAQPTVPMIQPVNVALMEGGQIGQR